MGSWLDTLTSAPALVAGLVGISFAVYAGRNPQVKDQVTEQVKDVAQATQAGDSKARMAQASASVMSAPAATLALPKNDPISASDLSAFDGKDPAKPIYVAIKGKVFDVSPKRDMYKPGTGYNVFAGKDASKGLGMSSLDPKDAVSDYSSLSETQMKTLDQWEAFFEKRYNIVGRVTN